MTRSDRTAGRLSELSRIATDLGDEQAPAKLAEALRDTSAAVVAEAARLIAKGSLAGLAEALAAAFERLARGGARADKGCRAKLSILTALNELDEGETEVFLAGAGLTQLETAYGYPGKVDTAAPLRGLASRALARRGYPNAYRIVADLLGDRWAEARLGATGAAPALPHPTGEALLRLKLRAGDEDPVITAACAEALLDLAPEDSLAVVAEFLGDEEELLRGRVALALGETRLPEAFEVLRERYEREPDPARRAELLLPMALIRDEASFRYVLGVVESPREEEALAALEALRMYRHDPGRREVIAGAVEDEAAPEVRDAFRDW